MPEGEVRGPVLVASNAGVVVLDAHLVLHAELPHEGLCLFSAERIQTAILEHRDPVDQPAVHRGARHRQTAVPLLFRSCRDVWRRCTGLLPELRPHGLQALHGTNAAEVVAGLRVGGRERGEELPRVLRAAGVLHYGWQRRPQECHGFLGLPGLACLECCPDHRRDGPVGLRSHELQLLARTGVQGEPHAPEAPRHDGRPVAPKGLHQPDEGTGARGVVTAHHLILLLVLSSDLGCDRVRQDIIQDERIIVINSEGVAQPRIVRLNAV
mmetsp:Transcript_103766/g.329933  ORF Transcript_103766/g.329933 Transcript_103766/m.329933 type:complete len:268 (-) Transcript_103766:334-1137(-)